MNGYLNNFVAAHDSKVSAALDELTVVIPRCRTYQFNWSFLLAAVHLWSMLPSGVFSGGTKRTRRCKKLYVNVCIGVKTTSFVHSRVNLTLLDKSTRGFNIGTQRRISSPIIMILWVNRLGSPCTVHCVNTICVISSTASSKIVNNSDLELTRLRWRVYIYSNATSRQ